MGATDPEVAKRNAQVEERLKSLPLPVLREESKQALATNLERTSGRYDLISQVAQRHGVNPDELYAKYVIETRGAKDPENPGVSTKGASGPFQLMPKIRKSYTDPSITDPFEREADAAARLIADVSSRNGFSPDATAVAYNYGEGNAREWGGNAVKKLPTESVNYVAYARYLRPILREQSKERDLLTAKAAVPVPKYEKQGFADYLMGKPSPTDVAIQQYDNQVKSAQGAVLQRYKENR